MNFTHPSSANWKSGIQVGKGTVISPLASFHGQQRIKIGSNCRIDDFVVISAGEGGIEIGDNVHIAPHCILVGGGKITISNDCQLSGRASIYSSSGDLKYLGESGSPTMLGEREKAITADVTMMAGCILGVGAVLMPGVFMNEHTVLGALSLATKGMGLQPFAVYAGSPAKFIKTRVVRS